MPKTSVSFYAEMFRKQLDYIGIPFTVDPRHIEAYFRVEYGTLDALSVAKIREELPEVVMAIRADVPAAERLAVSYGL